MNHDIHINEVTPPAAPADGALHIMRVADVPRSSLGGMGRFMFCSGRELERMGHTVTYAFAEELGRAPRHPRLRRVVIPWLIVARVWRAVRGGHAPDVVEIHEPSAGPYSVLRRRVPRLSLPPCVVLSYGLEERGWEAQVDRLARRGVRPRLRTRLLFPVSVLWQSRLALTHADQVAVPSDEDRDHLLHRLHVPAQRVKRVNTGVEPELFELERSPLSAVGGGPGGPLQLLFIGTWIDRKGTPELTAAWAALAARHPRLRLTVAGTGVPTADVVAAFPADSRGRVSVFERADREMIRDLLRRHDVFVLPSWFEGMPLSMLEAAAAGLPCVVSAVCGNVDFFRRDDPEGDGAILVVPHDADALQGALERLITDEPLRAQLGARGRARSRAFTWRDTAEQLLRAYRESLTGEP